MFISFTTSWKFQKNQIDLIFKKFSHKFLLWKKGFKSALWEYEFIKCSQIWWDENESTTKLIKVKYKYE